MAAVEPAAAAVTVVLRVAVLEEVVLEEPVEPDPSTRPRRLRIQVDPTASMAGTAALARRAKAGLSKERHPVTQTRPDRSRRRVWRVAALVALGVVILALVVLYRNVGEDRPSLSPEAPGDRSGVNLGPVLSGAPPPLHEPQPAPKRSLRVRDLASGLGVPGLPVELWSDQVSRGGMTTATGELVLPEELSHLSRIASASDAWTICDGQPRGAAVDVWAYRTISVRGLVRAIGADLDEVMASNLSLDVVMTGLPGSDVFEPSPYPWNRDGAQLLTSLGESVAAPRVDGSFEFEVPACRGLVVRCRGEGWCPAWSDIPVPPLDQDEVTVVIDLRRKPVIRGRVVLEPGADAKRSIVRANVLLRFPAKGFDPERGRLYGESFGLTVDKRGASLQLVVPVTLSQSGEFAVPIPVYGAEVQLTVHSPGHAPAHAYIPGVGDDVVGLEIAPRPDRSQPGVVFKVDGAPAGDARVALTDITDDPSQTLVELRLDANGAMTENWLERGRSYWVVLVRDLPPADDGTRRTAHNDGFLVWKGESTVEVTALGQDFDAARRGESGR